MSLSIGAVVHATPVWTFTPLTATEVVVPPEGSATIQYVVTNQSRVTHTLEMTYIPGVTHVTGPGFCSNPFVLHQGESCTLNLLVDEPSLSAPVTSGPIVCQQGSKLMCYRPSVGQNLNIRKDTATSFSVGGTIAGLQGTVTLQNSNGDTLIQATNGTFTFPALVAVGSTYSISVQNQPATQTCTVINGNGTMGYNNVTNVQVTCATNAYTVGGIISGLNGSVTLQNNGSDNVIQTANGSFAFTTLIAQGATYNVTVSAQPATQTCTVGNGSGTMGGSNVTNVTVSCAVNSYTVGGTVSGLNIGNVVILRNNNADELTRTANGNFVFDASVAQGSTYNVTVFTQPTNQTCTVTNGGGTMGSTNVTNVSVVCQPLFAYVANDLGSGANNITRCEILANGNFANCQIAATGFSNPFGIALDTFGDGVYISNASSNIISHCTFAPDNNLTACQTALPVTAGFTTPLDIVFNPTGTRIYIMYQNSNNILRCEVAPDGTNALTNCVNSTASTLNVPATLAFNQAGTRAYVTEFASSQVSLCDVNASNGDLLNCTPTGTNFTQPVGIVLNESLGYAYVVNGAVGRITRCTIEADGLLTNCAVLSSATLGNTSRYIVFNGGFAYITNAGSDNVSKCVVAANGDINNCITTGTNMNGATGLLFVAR